MASNGAMVGTTLYGGDANLGTIYRVAPRATGGAWAESVLHSFDATDGVEPAYELLPIADGGLAGVTLFGGPTPFCTPASRCFGNGTWFELTAPTAPGASWGFSNESLAGGSAGELPAGGLIQQNGASYGMFEDGGVSQAEFDQAFGAIYSRTP